jgi:hypothetical protein
LTLKVKAALVWVAIAIALLFVGTNVYRILCPPYWYVKCLMKGSPGQVLSSEQLAKEIAAEAEKRGQTCTVIPIRECRNPLTRIP